MPVHHTPAGALYYQVDNLVPPWAAPGEAIVFLHGLATDSNIWSVWLPLLADRYRLVRPDLRGFGKSYVPAPDDHWSVDTLARDVLGVVDAEGLDRVHFVGESTGGTVGLYLAINHPDRLLSLTTVSAAHTGGALDRAQQLREEMHTIGMDAWSEKLMQLRFHPASLTSEMYQWFHDTQRHSVPHACTSLVEMLAGTDLTEGLGGISTPTLILAPDDSPFLPVETHVERLRLVPDAELHVVSGARHGLAFSHGRDCARTLRAFLERKKL